ncbi:hypothetical protein, partial [Herbaspirillum rhizosphaerae]|uniref:hypothetical protein n=1 Tax=Herbaspirillum rhizosphaerae TaxID=346179 RepID=UPI001969A420
RGSRRQQAKIGKGKQLASLRHFSLLFPIFTCWRRLLSSGLRDWLASHRQGTATVQAALVSFALSFQRKLEPSAVTKFEDALTSLGPSVRWDDGLVSNDRR